MQNSTYRVLLLGDFHFGESYGAGSRVLEEHGYEFSTRFLVPFIEASDHFVVNLETPLVDPDVHPSTLKGQKKYIHWADPEGSANALKRLGVDAVSLANNHTMDHGEAGLSSTFDALRRVGIPWFGAGGNISQARAPHRVELPESLGGGEIALHGSFQYSRSHDEGYKFFAGESVPGCAPLSVSEIEDPSLGKVREDSFHIGFPHWGANYDWRTDGQFRLAQRMFDRGYDFILGHGSHAVQEVLRSQRRWCVYGIGNGNFQSRGRWESFIEQNGILPLSFWTMIEVSADNQERRQITCKLYPVYSDNNANGFQPAPVSENDFRELREVLAEKSPNAWRFDNLSSSYGHDDLGYYLQLDLGSWEQGKKPSGLEGLSADGSDPGDLPVRTISNDVQDSIQRLHKGGSFGPTLLAMAGEKHGASNEWISKNCAVITKGVRRFLVDGYIAHESALGEQCCKDKALTAQFLSEQGIATPRGEEVTSVEDAVAVAARLGRPVVIKPVDGNKSRGVAVNLSKEEEIRAAFLVAQSISHRVLVQDYIEVDAELRILASPEQAYAVNKRLLPHVIGDGASSIGQLIADKNTWRQLNPSLHNRPIPTDELTYRYLSRTGHSLDEVPGVGETVTVRDVGGLGAGGDTYQCYETTPERVKQAAAEAVAAIPGLQWAGVDLIIEKGTGDPYVIEVNTRAAYGAALTPTYGQPRDVAAALWDLRLKDTAKIITAKPQTVSALSQKDQRPLLEFLGVEGPIRLPQAIFKYAAAKGFTVTPHSKRLTHITTPNGEKKWMTTGGFTEKDRSAVVQLVNKHNHTRRLLGLDGVKRVKARNFDSKKNLLRAIKNIDNTSIVVPFRNGWGSLGNSMVRPGAAPKASALGRGPWCLQRYEEGLRFRVFADARRVWAVSTQTSLGPNRGSVSASIDAAGRAAVLAIRAVPELRWGVVDVVMRPQADRRSTADLALVEGVSLNTRLESQEILIAGSLKNFFDVLLDNENLTDPARAVESKGLGLKLSIRSRAIRRVRRALRRDRTERA